MKIIFLFYLLSLGYFVKCSYFSIELNRKRVDKQEGSELLSLGELALVHTFEKEEDSLKLKALIETKSYIVNNTSVASVPVTNYFNVQYYGNVYIGSLFQELSVIFDTGSNVLWVSDSSCVSCRNFTNKFDYLNSTTFHNLNETKNITYAIGYVEGAYAQDDVFISKNLISPIDNTFAYSMGVQGFKFILVGQEEFLDGTIADGVLGLGVDFEGDFHNSFVYMLYQQGQIKTPYFTFYLSDSKKGSRLYLGDITENTALSFIFNQMQYCSVDPRAHYWQCDMKKMTVQKYNPYLSLPVNTSDIIETNSKVIFDSGTSFLIIPANEFLFLLPKFINKALNNKCGVTPSLQFICQCKSPLDFDDIILSLDNNGVEQKFVIRSENIIEFFPTLEFQCRFEILIDIFMMDAWILGDSVIRDSFLTFDMQARRIGWVQDIEKISDAVVTQNAQNDMNNEYAATNAAVSSNTDYSTMFWYSLCLVFILAISYYIIRLAMNFAQSARGINPQVVPLNNEQNI